MAIKENEVVSMEYQVSDAITKEVFDSNVGNEPLEFIVGKGQIIPGLENEIMNLSNGDKADILVEPTDAYGDYNEDATDTLPKEQFSGIELKEGMTLYGNGENGQTVQVLVKSFDDEKVVVDYNHPLAGKTLMFNIKVMNVREANIEEIETGVIGGYAAMDSGCCGGGSCGTHEKNEVESCGSDNSAPEKGCGCSH